MVEQTAVNSLHLPSQNTVLNDTGLGHQLPVPVFINQTLPSYPDGNPSVPNLDFSQQGSNAPHSTTVPYVHVPQPQGQVPLHHVPVPHQPNAPQPSLDEQLQPVVQQVSRLLLDPVRLQNEVYVGDQLTQADPQLQAPPGELTVQHPPPLVRQKSPPPVTAEKKRYLPPVEVPMTRARRPC